MEKLKVSNAFKLKVHEQIPRSGHTYHPLVSICSHYFPQEEIRNDFYNEKSDGKILIHSSLCALAHS